VSARSSHAGAAPTRRCSLAFSSAQTAAEERRKARFGETVTTYSAKEIAVRLSTLQRGIVACGPTSFAKAAAIVGLFACSEIRESDSGEE
jgi:hypothetical protein